MSTYAMDEQGNRALYDLGIADYDAARQDLMLFMGSDQADKER